MHLERYKNMYFEYLACAYTSIHTQLHIYIYDMHTTCSIKASTVVYYYYIYRIHIHVFACGMLHTANADGPGSLAASFPDAKQQGTVEGFT